jgi:hypothetical protein
MAKIEEGDAELRLPLLLLPTTAVSAVITGEVAYGRLPLRGLDLCLTQVAYLHLTTPASEVQCLPSRASILQHAGLESSPSCR